MSRLAWGADGAALVVERTLALVDAAGAHAGARKLEKAPDAVARFGDEWLVSVPKQKSLGRVDSDAAAPFAAGKTPITAFAVGRDDAVTVARGDAVELWSRDDERLWAAKGASPVRQLVLGRDQVIALGEDGAIYFFDRDKGAPLGALRLASPEPIESFRLAHVDGAVVVLTLGEWIVWIDAKARKTIRRVRARAKITAIAADAELVAVAVEDGVIQSFRSKSGEPRATIESEDVTALALGPSQLFMVQADASEVRAVARESLDAAVRTASPVSCMAARAQLTAVGDRTGRIRVYESLDGGIREVGTLASGEWTVGLFVSSAETVVAASERVVMSGTWSTDSNITGVRKVPTPPPRPIGLKSPPTAFAADDAYVFVGTQTGSVDVHDLGTGRPVTTYALSSDDRITALLRLGGATLVVGTGALDGRVLVVNVADAEVVHRLSPHEEAFGVTCLASDARGRLVASGSDEGTIALIDPVKGRILAKLRVTESPTSLAFEPSGRRLACVFADGTAAIATFTPKGATIADLGLRGATRVAWGDGLVVGFKDGRVESGERHARASDRPSEARG